MVLDFMRPIYSAPEQRDLSKEEAGVGVWGGVWVGYGPTCYGLDAGGTEVILCQQSGHVTLLKQMVLQISIDKLHCKMSR